MRFIRSDLDLGGGSNSDISGGSDLESVNLNPDPQHVYLHVSAVETTAMK